jgi:hypothetical protein
VHIEYDRYQGCEATPATRMHASFPTPLNLPSRPPTETLTFTAIAPYNLKAWYFGKLVKVQHGPATVSAENRSNTPLRHNALGRQPRFSDAQVRRPTKFLSLRVDLGRERR